MKPAKTDSLQSAPFFSAPICKEDGRSRDLPSKYNAMASQCIPMESQLSRVCVLVYQAESTPGRKSCECECARKHNHAKWELQAVLVADVDAQREADASSKPARASRVYCWRFWCMTALWGMLVSLWRKGKTYQKYSEIGEWQQWGSENHAKTMPKISNV